MEGGLARLSRVCKIGSNLLRGVSGKAFLCTCYCDRNDPFRVFYNGVRSRKTRLYVVAQDHRVRTSAMEFAILKSPNDNDEKYRAREITGCVVFVLAESYDAKVVPRTL